MRRTEWIAPLLLAVFLLAAPLIFHQDPLQQNRDQILTPPSRLHWFGTDDYGRDLWTRFLHGGRWSVATGLTSVLLCLLLAWILGTAAGMASRWNLIIMWVADLFLCLPWIYLLIAVRSAMPLELRPQEAFLAIMLLLAATGWARPARLVRGKVLEISQRGYVQAALGFGASKPRIFWRHVLPATGDLLAAQAILLLPRFVLAELTLSFLGAGGSDPAPSWGSLVLPLKQIYLAGSQWWLLLPVVAMTPFFAVFTFCSRALDLRFRLLR
jgi:peptide/nickel transport system permease protein